MLCIYYLLIKRKKLLGEINTISSIFSTFCFVQFIDLTNKQINNNNETFICRGILQKVSFQLILYQNV